MCVCAPSTWVYTKLGGWWEGRVRLDSLVCTYVCIGYVGVHGDGWGLEEGEVGEGEGEGGRSRS